MQPADYGLFPVPTLLVSMAEHDLVRPNVCQMLYAKNTKMSSCIRSHFAVCKPEWFSGCSDQQSTVQQKICHIDWGGDRAQADFSCLLNSYFFCSLAELPLLQTAKDVWTKVSNNGALTWRSSVSWMRILQETVCTLQLRSLIKVKRKKSEM